MIIRFLRFSATATVALAIMTAGHVSAQTYGIQIDIGSKQIAGPTPAHFIVIDPLGYRSGFDPLTGQWLSEILGANYAAAGLGNLDTTYVEEVPYEFLTSDSVQPPSGYYTVRVVGISVGSFHLSVSVDRDTSTSNFSASRTAQPGQITYYTLYYNNNLAIPATFSAVAATRQIPGGIVNPSGTYNISIRAKPNTMFTNATLETGVATVRWLVASGATMGGVTSTYGYAKWDSLIVIGGYNYQKVRSTSGAHIAKWNPNTEYELFYAPMSGTNGPVTVELTNAIPGGEWFVDLNYSDKSDTTFYRRSASVPLPYQKPVK